MPVSKKKPITSSPEGSTPESSSSIAPDQEEFRRHLRRLAMSAVQVLIEQVMREALTDMFVSGTSTQKVGKVAEKLLRVAPSASTVSRLNQALTEQYETWRERWLLAHYRIIYAGRSSTSRCGMAAKRMRP